MPFDKFEESIFFSSSMVLWLWPLKSQVRGFVEHKMRYRGIYIDSGWQMRA